MTRTLVVVPTYDEAENIDTVLAASEAARRRRPGRGRQQPRRHGDRVRRTRYAPGAPARPARQGRAGGGLPRRVRLGAGRAATTPSSRWTPTCRTRRSGCPHWSRRSDGPTSASARATSRGGGVRDWPWPRRLISGPATSTSGWCWGSRSTTPRPASRPSAARRWRHRRRLDRVHGYCFQIENTWRAAPGAAVVRGADHVQGPHRGQSKMSGKIVVEAIVRRARLAAAPGPPRYEPDDHAPPRALLGRPLLQPRQRTPRGLASTAPHGSYVRRWKLTRPVGSTWWS